MKKIGIILLFIFSYKNIFAQVERKPDRFRVYSALTSGLVVMRLSGTMDQSNAGSNMVSTGPSNYPKYRYTDTTALAVNFIVAFGFNIPVYRSEKWSTGFNLSAGVGYMAGVKAANGLAGMSFDFPQFIYYRRYSGKIDYSVLAGWKYSYGPLPYQLGLLGMDVHFNDTKLRLYFSPMPYTYYRQLTTGAIEPAAKIYEVGLGFFVNY